MTLAKRMTGHELAALPHYHPALAEIWTYPAECPGGIRPDRIIAMDPPWDYAHRHANAPPHSPPDGVPRLGLDGE